MTKTRCSLLAALATVAVLLTLTPTLAQVSPPPAPPAAAPAGDDTAVDPAVVARAKDWLHRAQVGTIDRSQLDDAMNSAMTDSAVTQFASQIGPLGAPTSFVFIAKKHFPDNTAYKFRVTFKTATLFWLFVVDDGGKISGLRLMPDTPAASAPK